MSEDNDIGRIITPEARWVYPHLFKPREEVAGRKLKSPKFEVELLFTPDQMQGMKDAAIAAARAKWPTRDLKTIRFPFKSGDQTNAKRVEAGKKPYEYRAGKITLKASSSADYRPQIVDRNSNPIIDASQVYSGCYGHAELRFHAYDGNGEDIKDGVTAYINCGMKTRDGERIGGRDIRQVFAGVMGKSSDEDPTAGLDDEIPF